MRLASLRWTPPLDPLRRAVYCAPSGSDMAASGTLQNPFKSLGAAADFAARSQIATLILRGGIYPVAAPFRPPAGLTVRAYPNEIPVISGGQPVVGWQAHSGDIIRAPRTHQYRQLYINGTPALLSRSAYFRTLHWWDVEGIPVDEVNRQNGRVIAISTADYVAAGSPGAGAVFVLQRDWADNYLPVASVSTVGPKTFVAFTPEAEAACFNLLNPAKHSPYSYHFENLPALAPGEWRYEAAWVYYRLRVGESLGTINALAPFAKTLVDIAANNITFDGIQFSHSNYFAPLGKVTFQGDSQVYLLADTDPSIPAAVRVANCSGFRATRCRFTRLGGNALELGEGSQNAIVEGNRFDSVAAGGVVLVGPRVRSPQLAIWLVDYEPNPPLGRQCRGHRIINNLFVNIAETYWGSCPIFGAFVADCEVSRNEIVDPPYSAIAFGFRWDYSPTYAAGLQILNNRIVGPVMRLTDGAGIYTLGWQPGSEISGNHVINIAGNGASYRDVVLAIYNDAGSRGFAGANNVYSNLSPINGGSGVSGGAGDLVAAYLSNASPADNSIAPPLPDTAPGAAGVIAAAGRQNHWITGD